MDKIDLIIDALEKAKDGWQCFDEYEKALAAAHELRGQMQITVKRTKVYGNGAIYPVCDTAIRLTKLGVTKTITPRQIDIIKALGYKINLAPQEEV